MQLFRRSNGYPAPAPSVTTRAAGAAILLLGTVLDPVELCGQTPTARYREAMDRALAVAADVRTALVRMAAGVTPAVAEERRRAALAAGLPRLNHTALIRRTELLGRALDHAPTRLCAAWARGQLLDLDLPEFLSPLEEDQLDLWAGLTVEALRYGLDSFPLDRRGLAGLTELVTRVQSEGPAHERARILTTFETLGAAGEEDACWLARRLVLAASEAPPETRGARVEALAWFEAMGISARGQAH